MTTTATLRSYLLEEIAKMEAESRRPANADVREQEWINGRINGLLSALAWYTAHSCRDQAD